ncbi:MAG: ABC transporter ATP-binding protein [Bacillota bacterium]|nr:ABC transporter ATP-binding protein [Bacillota bacterium]MDW7684170.1 ABC transporter ATP-binding protein [Bacillota bacterium]
MLSFENVSKTYSPDITAVDGITLEVKQGEVMALIGPSGCGKTTLLKMINRIIEPTSGKIFYEGRETSRWNPTELRRQIGYVIQQVGLFPHFTVAQNIGYVLQITGARKRGRREQAAGLLELVGMGPSFLDRYPRELSGGQAQRVGFARALAGNPKMILMDEPFGALDQVTRLQLQDELQALQKKLGKTIIFVTHDIQEAMKVGDRVALMRSGKLIQVGTPLEYFNCPRNEFVADFVGMNDFIHFLQQFQVRDVMVSANKYDSSRFGAEVLTPDTPLAEALRTMLFAGKNILPVVDDNGKITGQVTFAEIHDALSASFHNGCSGDAATS